jgi:hypothetical protein
MDSGQNHAKKKFNDQDQKKVMDPGIETSLFVLAKIILKIDVLLVYY